MMLSNSNAITTASSWFDEIVAESKNQQLEDDPVALSCAVFREWQTNQLARFLDLNHATALPQDHDTAAGIRDYYSKKFTYQVLMGHKLSKFRQTLIDLMAETRQVPPGRLGMLYRLPGFYHEDVETDHMFKHVTPGVEAVYQQMTEQKQQFLLTPLQKIRRDAKPRERTRFWYLTQQGFALCITVTVDNSLYPLFNSLYDRGPTQLTGHARLKTGFAPEQSYLELLQPTLD